jgi:hypothetical protein
MSTDAARTPEETARFQGRLRVDDTLERLAVLTTKIRRTRDEVARLAGCEDLARLIGQAAEQVEATRKELMQGAYFGAGQDRLF